MNFGKSILLSLLSICALFSFGCSGDDSAEVSASVESSEAVVSRFRVVCTIGMITDVVRNIAGEGVEVDGVISEGVDPHLYQPTRDDVVRISRADLVFYNGLYLEGKMSDVLFRVRSVGKPVHAVTETILENPEYLLDADDGSEYTDPHVWMDVSGWMQAVAVITDVLIAFDPDNRELYTLNSEAYLAKLKALDQYAKQAMATIPSERRVLVTAHDAFNYLGRAYGIEVRGIQGISTESEAGVKDLKDLVDFLVQRSIPAVFVESSVADKNVRALVEGAQARGHSVVIGGELFSDAMGPEGTYEGTYIGMIDHNITTIVNALGGDAKGFKAMASEVGLMD